MTRTINVSIFGLLGLASVIEFELHFSGLNWKRVKHWLALVCYKVDKADIIFT